MNRNGRLFAMLPVAMAFALSVLFVSCAASADAQASRVGATLEGIVSDTSGAVIPNAKVTLNNSLTNQSRSVTTDEQVFFSGRAACRWHL
jgi:hypothetical protein